MVFRGRALADGCDDFNLSSFLGTGESEAVTDTSIGSRC